MSGFDCVSEYTEIKQQHFGGIASIIVGAVRGIARRKPLWDATRCFEYFDLYAGPGRYCVPNGNDIDGSPVIFSRIIAQSGLSFRSYLFEQAPDNARQLRDCNLPHSTIIEGDNLLGIRPFLRVTKTPRFGLIYADPKGVLNWQLLQWMSRMKRYEKTDVLINIQAARGVKLHRTRYPDKFRMMTDELADIQKKHWLIREPYGKQQWTFLFGTNWGDLPKWKKAGFHDIGSDSGRNILYELNFTNAEKRAMEKSRQPSLFDL